MKRFAILTISSLILFSSLKADQSLEKAGDLLQYAVPAFGAWMILAKQDTEGLWQYGGSFATSIVTTWAMKSYINRPRPNGGKHSFPSGHTSAAFTGAAFIQKRYGWNYGAPAYAAAMFVGWSRIQARKHHVTDVMAGAVLGVVSAYLFTRPYEKTGIEVSLFAAENKTYGLRFNYNF